MENKPVRKEWEFAGFKNKKQYQLAEEAMIELILFLILIACLIGGALS